MSSSNISITYMRPNYTLMGDIKNREGGKFWLKKKLGNESEVGFDGVSYHISMGDTWWGTVR